MNPQQPIDAPQAPTAPVGPDSALTQPDQQNTISTETAKKIVSVVQKASPALDLLVTGQSPSFGLNLNIGKQAQFGSSNLDQPLYDHNRTASRTIKGRAGAVMVLLLSLAFIGGGYLMLKSSKIPDNYKTTAGKVSNATAIFQESGGSYYPTYEFVANNTVYSFKGSVGQKTRPVVGNTIKVAYDPANPNNKPRNASEKGTKIVSYILLVVGPLLAC
jgi:hypothetical protein